MDSIYRQVNAAAGGAIPMPTAVGSTNHIPPTQSKPKIAKKQVKAETATSSNQMAKPTPVTSKSSAATTANVDPDRGHYELEGTTYLEGSVYAACLFEDNIPIQFWTGNPNATDDELRDLRNTNYWKTALLARVIRNSNKNSQEMTCHVSYLNNSQDMEEVIEKNVPPRRIRLVLGSDSVLPSTLEEARLALSGGEQTVMVANTEDCTPEIDENTGLSSWSTTTVTKISTHYYEANQEKKRKQREEKETKERNEMKDHEIRGRRMEEAKYENAHDSALGAYDVWNTSEKGGGSYKGVDITKDGKVDVSETAKSLSKGMGSVAFKKRKVVKKGARKTSADEI